MSSLLEPLRFPSGAVAPNRVWLAPLTNTLSHDDGSLAEEEKRWLVRRAAGGFGVIETCATFVSSDGQAFPRQLAVSDDRQIPALAELARAIAEHGALSLVQLNHGGARSPAALTGSLPLSATSFEEPTPGFVPPRAATEHEIELLIEHFVAATRRAAVAGFSGVELHAAHGYLLSQFLSRSMNRRDDAWGGAALEKRARLLLTILRRARHEIAAPFLIGVRLSPEDRGNARGLDPDETATVARWLADEGADFIHLSLWDTSKPLRKRPDEHPLALFRRRLGQALPLIAAGAIWDHGDALTTLARGADAVALGKAAILNPEWPSRITDSTFVPVRGPLTPREFAALDVGMPFVDYLRRFGMVSE